MRIILLEALPGFIFSARNQFAGRATDIYPIIGKSFSFHREQTRIWYLLLFGCILTSECGNHRATDASFFYSQISSSSSSSVKTEPNAPRAAAVLALLSFFFGFSFLSIFFFFPFFCCTVILSLFSGSRPTNIINKAKEKEKKSRVERANGVTQTRMLCLYITLCVQLVLVCLTFVF